MADQLVRLTVVQTELEAEMLCGLLRAEGIECSHRTTDLSHVESFSNQREVLVAADDLTFALELLDARTSDDLS
jgi:hypothetical protein